MASTRAELRERVENFTKRTDKADVINDALDMALDEIYLLHKWRELMTIKTLEPLEDATSISLPTGTHKIIEARFIDGTSSYKIRLLTRTKFLKWFPNVSDYSASKPRFAYYDSSTMYFSCPMSDDSDIYVMCYIKPSFASDSTECPIAVAENAITFYAVSLLYDSMEMPTIAHKWDLRYVRAVKQAIRADEDIAGTEIVAEGFKGFVDDDYSWINWVPDSLSV